MPKRFLLFVFLIFVCLMFASSAEAREQKVTLVSAGGTVEIIKKGAAVGSHATPGYLFQEGDSIQTHDDGYAELYFEDTGTVYIQPSSYLTIKSAQIEDDVTTTINTVKSGEIKAKVRRLTSMKSEFKMATPVAVAAVRGTIYIVRVKSDGHTTVYVLEGKVELTSLLTKLGVTLEAGQSSAVDARGTIGEIRTGSDPGENVEHIDIDLDQMKRNAGPPAPPVDSRGVESQKVAPKKKSKYSSG